MTIPTENHDAGLYVIRLFCVVCFLLLVSQDLAAGSLNECMIRMVENGSDNLTLGEIREICRDQNDNLSVVEERIRQEEEIVFEPFTIMAHKPSFFIPLAYNSHGYETSAYLQHLDDPSVLVDDVEAQFQLSIKIPLLVDLFKKNIDIFAAYTNHSFWQLYNDRSAPFRETDHEPEAWLQVRPDWKIFGFKNSVNAFGISHQSNGRGGYLSRSWNRLFANFVLEHEHFALSFKPWFRLPVDFEDDNNPDITDYLGHYELRGAYKTHKHVFQVMSRNNLESGFSRGAFEFTWSFPLGNYPYVKGYIQYFSGYGESLIGYDQYVNKIGLGFALSDWL